MELKFRANSEKWSLGTQVNPTNIDYWHLPPEPKISDFGYRPFDVTIMTYKRKGINGDPVGTYSVFFPPRSVVMMRPGKVSSVFNGHYFEQVYLNRPNSMVRIPENWVTLKPDVQKSQKLYLWIARVNGTIRACLGLEEVKPKFVLHEIHIATLPAMTTWFNGTPIPPILPTQHYHGQYMFFNDGSAKFFSFQPVNGNLKSKGVPNKTLLSGSDESEEEPIEEEECNLIPQNPYVNVSGKTIKIAGWSLPGEHSPDEHDLYLRIHGITQATLEFRSEREEADKLFPNSIVIRYVTGAGELMTENLCDRVINVPIVSRYR